MLAKLEEKGLTPNAPADRRHLIRRAYLDLLGLPPSPEEVEAFVADPAADAYEKLIDRLLDNPHYGERWARHWLDLAALRRQPRLRTGLRPADGLSLPRLRYQGVQPGFAL